MTSMAHLEEHLRVVTQYAEQGMARGGHRVRAEVLDEHADRGGEWQLFVTSGPNVPPEGPGPMSLWAGLSEEVSEINENTDEDSVETFARAQLRTTGEYPETIAKLATWLLANGWRAAEGGRLVSHEPMQAEFIEVDGAMYVVRQAPAGQGTEPIES